MKWKLNQIIKIDCFNKMPQKLSRYLRALHTPLYSSNAKPKIINESFK